MIYVVGKGPSLDMVTKETFEDRSAPVIALNESVRIVQSLDIANPLYSLQQDGMERCMVRPQRGTLMLSEVSKHYFPDYYPRLLYDRVAMGLSPIEPACIVAMHFAKKWGYDRVIFLAFDACMNGDVTYASTLELKYQPANKIDHLTHCKLIRQYAKQHNITRIYR